MYKKAVLIVSLFILVGMLVSCSSDSLSNKGGVDNLPNKGGAIKQGNSWIELKQFNGNPDSFTNSGIPLIEDRRPVISLWMEVQGKTVDMFKMQSLTQGEKTITLNVTPQTGGSVQYRPNQDLVAGNYCVIWHPQSINDFNQFFC